MRAEIIGMKISALGGVVFWGLFMNLMMINVILGQTNDHVDRSDSDASVGASLLTLSIVPIVVRFGTKRYLANRAKDLKEIHKKKFNDDDDGLHA